MRRWNFVVCVSLCLSILGCVAKKGTVVCPECWGTGHQVISDQRCWFCKGTASSDGESCQMCGGTGFQSEPCKDCEGRGWLRSDELPGASNGGDTPSSPRKERTSGKEKSGADKDQDADVAKIRSVQIEPGQKTTRIIVAFDGQVAIKPGNKDNEYHLDISPARYMGIETSWDVSEGPVTKVMAAQVGVSEPTCRIVVLLRGTVHAEVITAPGELVIEATTSQ